MENQGCGFFYYNYNLVANERNKIHSSSCCECKSGLGKRWFVKRLTKDIWMGPFDSKEQAREQILLLFNKKAEFHECCQIVDLAGFSSVSNLAELSK